MMNVKDDELVIEQKGIYSVENFLIARRLMYWQVYLHKTCLVAETILVKTLQRAKELTKKGTVLPASVSLQYFLQNPITEDNFTDETLEIFSRLDDYDILSAIKEWIFHDDMVLSALSKMIINRNLLKIELQDKVFTEKYKNKVQTKLTNNLEIASEDLHYFMFFDKVENQAYNNKKPIKILTKKGKLKDMAKASDQLNVQTLTKPVVKHYFCYPKKLLLY